MTTCKGCDDSFKPYYLRDGICNGCRSPELIVKAIVAAQSKLCEHCPEGDRDTNTGEHSDDCLVVQDLVTVAPDLIKAVLDIIPDLEHYCSKQGSGPDDRLARLKELISKLEY